jgi:large subunit ribosomal protein L35
MPKLKTKRGAAKRFAVTARGKVKHKKAYLRHLLSSKNRGRKRRLGAPGVLNKVQAKIVRTLLPYQ